MHLIVLLFLQPKPTITHLLEEEELIVQDLDEDIDRGYSGGATEGDVTIVTTSKPPSGRSSTKSLLSKSKDALKAKTKPEEPLMSGSVRELRAPLGHTLVPEIRVCSEGYLGPGRGHVGGDASPVKARSIVNSTSEAGGSSKSELHNSSSSKLSTEGNKETATANSVGKEDCDNVGGAPDKEGGVSKLSCEESGAVNQSSKNDDTVSDKEGKQSDEEGGVEGVASKQGDQEGRAQGQEDGVSNEPDKAEGDISEKVDNQEPSNMSKIEHSNTSTHEMVAAMSKENPDQIDREGATLKKVEESTETGQEPEAIETKEERGEVNPPVSEAKQTKEEGDNNQTDDKRDEDSNKEKTQDKKEDIVEEEDGKKESDASTQSSETKQMKEEAAKAQAQETIGETDDKAGEQENKKNNVEEERRESKDDIAEGDKKIEATSTDLANKDETSEENKKPEPPLTDPANKDETNEEDKKPEPPLTDATNEEEDMKADNNKENNSPQTVTLDNADQVPIVKQDGDQTDEADKGKEESCNTTEKPAVNNSATKKETSQTSSTKPVEGGDLPADTPAAKTGKLTREEQLSTASHVSLTGSKTSFKSSRIKLTGSKKSLQTDIDKKTGQSQLDLANTA